MLLMVRFDIHVHTDCSPCGELQIRDILQNAKSLGLDGVCITDHATMRVRQRVHEGVQPDGLCVIVGMEYTTADGDFLLFGPFESVGPGLSAPDLLKMVKERDGAVVAAHPCRSERTVAEYVFRKGLCTIVESVNGRNTAEENFKAKGLLRQHSLAECGGSDAHSLDELGCATTVFDVPIGSRAELINALRNGLCRPETKPSGVLSPQRTAL